ncbi:3-oxoacyl-[acyl-carrier-protein] reductase-like [Oscarella lobularis]|uniref:3-oxoacyl-[acyl-carrier-protein] reductase-like n=1 Tax=Oscarella lobularis TaxID=121494 RepID=UPI0033140BEC
MHFRDIQTGNCAMSSSKVCVVFGGSRGIGRAVCNRMVAEGYRVVAASRNPDKELENDAAVVNVACDVADERAIASTARRTIDLFGAVDVVVNSAGINRDSLFVRTKFDDVRRLFDVNLIGSMAACKAFLPFMLKQRRGSIVNVGSVVGLIGNEGQCGYSASKAGLVGFNRSLAKEVAARGIRVNLVAPGFVRTDMTVGLDEEKIRKGIPLGRFGNSDEIASAVYFAATADGISGQVFVVDGGLSCTL